MTAKYWTKDGEVMCRLKVKTQYVFENLDTGEVVTLDNMHDIMDAGFLPVTMPMVKKKKTKKTKVKKTPKVAKTSRRGPQAKSKYKGVRKQGNKFAAQYWDGKKAKHLGMFDSELIAAATVLEAKGEYGEAKRLRNEYEEGDPPPQEKPSEE